MTRQHREVNALGVAITVAATIFVAAFVLLIRHPELIGWLVAAYAVCALLCVGLVAAEARDEAKGLRDLRAEREAAEAAEAGWRDVVRVPVVSRELFSDAEPQIEDQIRANLRVVPTQRDGEHDRLAMSREEWAAIERETREL